jgi:hypothetical protein
MPLDTNGLLAAKDVKTFFVSHDAMQAIAAMFRHNRAVADAYGRGSAEYAAQAESLATCLTAVLSGFGFGRCMSITREAPLSLYCNEDGALVFGMIFHADRSKAGAAVIPGIWSLHS